MIGSLAIGRPFTRLVKSNDEWRSNITNFGNNFTFTVSFLEYPKYKAVPSIDKENKQASPLCDCECVVAASAPPATTTSRPHVSELWKASGRGCGIVEL